jgi:dolichol-phosphate mannosyltransferase
VGLVQACLRTGFESFVNSGSSSEYGLKDHAPSETDYLEPNSHYAVAKASATLFCRYTALSLGVSIPTLRLYSVYGPYEEPTRLMPTLILHGLRGKWPCLVNPDIARDFVAVDDVCDAYLAAAGGACRDPGAVYNVGTGIQTSIRDVVEVARRTLGVDSPPAWGSMQDRTWDTYSWVSDNRKIRRDLGWEPKVPFLQGFRQLVAWLNENPMLREQVYEPRVAWNPTPPSERL